MSEEKKHLATCGHEDSLGYFAGTVCGKCSKAGHKKAMGKGTKSNDHWYFGDKKK
jgi:hypothetical protein